MKPTHGRYVVETEDGLHRVGSSTVVPGAPFENDKFAVRKPSKVVDFENISGSACMACTGKASRVPTGKVRPSENMNGRS